MLSRLGVKPLYFRPRVSDDNANAEPLFRTRRSTPVKGFVGDDQAILAARHALYLVERELDPARWSGDTRNWASIDAVTLNPQHDSIIKTQLARNDIQQLAA
jgi:putative transposase